MTNPAHAADDDERKYPSTDDLRELVSSMTGPMGAMLTALTTGAVSVFETLLQRSNEMGYERGLAEAEHRVARQVGLPATDGGVAGTLIRCTHCDGEGLLFQPNRDRREATGSTHPTTIIPRISSDPAATTVIPRIGEGQITQQHLDHIRRQSGT